MLSAPLELNEMMNSGRDGDDRGLTDSVACISRCSVMTMMMIMT